MAEKKELKEEVIEDIRKLWSESLKGLKRLGEEAAKLSKRSEGKIVEASRKLGKEATVMARQGEEKLIGVSRMGKLSLDVLGLKRKKENRLKEIGGKVYLAGPEKVDQSLLKKLCREVKKI
ncbi:hypothetical protein LR013_00185, partial [candidate division NPL-UPA2 bacterium]|nr:hypothetical protein [candidate division NPL-UPA2 bacterium]